ncbi:MAG: hypothetical protein JWP87_6310 [Labilithrix sp.]|jgi:hypothetical protein|nr:hypothetical protein [Labilithrix sp.]
MRHPIGFTLALCTILGCGTPAVPHSAPTTSAAAGPEGAPRAPTGARNAPAGEGPSAPASRCRLTVTDTEGCGPRDVEALLAPVRTRLESCRGASGGKLRVRVRKVAGKLAFDVEPGSSLDPTEKQCVLDALSTIHDDESATAWTGLNVRPTGFTSLITIEW